MGNYQTRKLDYKARLMKENDETMKNTANNGIPEVIVLTVRMWRTLSVDVRLTCTNGAILKVLCNDMGTTFQYQKPAEGRAYTTVKVPEGYKQSIPDYLVTFLEEKVLNRAKELGCIPRIVIEKEPKKGGEVLEKLKPFMVPKVERPATDPKEYVPF